MTTGAGEAALPDAGDIVWVDFRPTLGREQSGVRPALVLTARGFHQRNATAIVCAVTSNVTAWPTKVVLPDGLGVAGAVLCDQIRCVDRSMRGFRKIGTVPPDVLDDVRRTVATLLGLRLDS
ncbi:type II toxin-antitoxin system PemK/MazF family toxin [Methylobacterium sp. E-045]|uniref:type II toxin-antitoxin system PemK/MazF family toxin n=1 Tax=Methylobacterium sp. E-045 TaxID=2836575 RepID=UPI001FBA0768|nr:type II toxin-antitoxin system PemK/MazF family toxin [Methylobacterium sp. E-045]MCJ2130492.1 type II toxin-antitoxin system PemK/MazF family toxin [Methylobacterium sp. E-045]